MKKFISKIHLWLSIPFGLVIMILCLTGALLVFESEILEFSHPSLYRANITENGRMPISELMPKVKEQLPDSVLISSVQIPSNLKKNYRMGFGQGRTSLLVDPYTAEVKGEVNPYARGTFFSFVRRCHRWFMFQYSRGEFSWGKLITGVSTLVFVVIMITGIIIWVPKTIKLLKTRLSIKTNASRFRFWYDTHLAGGIWVALLLLAMCLTGLTWSFNWYRDGFYKVFGVDTSRPAQTVQQALQTGGQGDSPSGERSGGGRPEGNFEERGGGDRGNNPERTGASRVSGAGDSEGRSGRGGSERRGAGYTDYSAWDAVFASLSQSNPRFKTITVQSGSASVSNNRSGNTRASDSYTFDTRTGEITDSRLYKDQDKSAKIRGWIYAVHVGTWGGITTRILYFIACVVGASLPLTGYYIYLKKWRVRRKKKLQRE
ncbi:MAG: PepSY domain-containing protein [Rikenellaceae bacterium]|nr:PepSY domain-containing protein [Rikenellaceae bacterium]